MKITKTKLKQIIKEALSAQNEAMSDDEVFAITRASSKAERAGWRSDEFEHFKSLVMNAIERAVPEATDEALQSIAQNMRAHLENLSADLRDTPGGLMPRLTREFLAALAVEAARISPQLELPMNESPRKDTMKLTKSRLKQIIKEELATILTEGGTLGHYSGPRAELEAEEIDLERNVAGLVSAILGRRIGPAVVPPDIASDPAYAAGGHGLQEGEYGIRGQYIVYRSEGQLKTIDTGTTGSRHWGLLGDALKRAGWRYNENAGIPTPEDFVGAR